MANAGRRLGVNIFTLMQKSGISREELAEKMNFTYRDMCRVLEGRLLLTPVQAARVVELLGTTMEYLLHCESDKFGPELQYMKEFSDRENLDKILDLLDEYVDLKEAM